MKQSFKLVCSCKETLDGFVFNIGNSDKVHCKCGNVWEIRLCIEDAPDPTEQLSAAEAANLIPKEIKQC